MLLAVRLIYMVLLTTVALLPFVGTVTDDATFRFRDCAGAFLVTFLFGAAVLVVDALTPNKKLASVLGIYLGIIAGLVGALAVGALVDLVAQSWDLNENPWIGERGLLKLAIGITLCYVAVSIVLTTKDDFRLVIPYVEFARQVRGVRPLLLDTSALIDGRIDSFGRTGFLDAPLIVPRFVIDELQILADSGDRLKRARGRRGLDLVTSLQANPQVDLSIDAAEGEGLSVDHMLIRMAADQNLRILTTDYNLNKVAQIQEVTVLNLNDLANTLRPQVVAGDHLDVEIVKPGEAAGQGVGYLPEGTMVVVEGAGERIGETVTVTVTNALQTSAGRMVFGKLEDDGPPEPPKPAPRTGRPAPRGEPTPSRRNPRR
ncbi:MAG: TRAM domain-containing protein [Planctomycetes bacterium]|nr:TRAM domain-containing protein [Planctomycetota bacterium]